MADLAWLEALGPALDRWRSAGIITAEQATAIRDLELQAAPPTRPPAALPRLNPATLVTVIGAFLVVVATVVFVALGWQDMGRVQQFAWGTLAVAVPWTTAVLLRRTEQRLALQVNLGAIVAGNLALLLFFYTFFRLTGVWPDQSDLPGNEDSTRNLMMLNFGLTATAAAIIAFWRRLPFMLLLAGVLGWMTWMPLMDALWGQEGGDPVAWRTAVYGLILVAVGIVLAARGLRAYAFWLFLVGLAVSFLFLGIDAYDNALGTTGLLFLALAFAAIVISLWLEFRIFLVFGALGLYGWISALVIETFGGSRPVTFLLIVVGAAIVAAGLGWQRWMGPRLRGRGMAPGPGSGSMPTSGA